MKKELFEAYQRGSSSNFLESEESYFRRKYTLIIIAIFFEILVIVQLIYFFSQEISEIITIARFLLSIVAEPPSNQCKTGWRHYHRCIRPNNLLSCLLQAEFRIEGPETEFQLHGQLHTGCGIPDSGGEVCGPVR